MPFAMMPLREDFTFQEIKRESTVFCRVVKGRVCRTDSSDPRPSRGDHNIATPEVAKPSRPEFSFE